jgi:hypothetical protein
MFILAHRFSVSFNGHGMPCPCGRIFFIKRGDEAWQLETRDLGCARLKKQRAQPRMAVPPGASGAFVLLCGAPC